MTPSTSSQVPRPASTRPAKPAKPAAPVLARPARLLTEVEVLGALRTEIAQTSLSAVAKRYGLQSSQISDVLYGRANLSQRMIGKLRLKLHKFYERVPSGRQIVADRQGGK